MTDEEITKHIVKQVNTLGYTLSPSFKARYFDPEKDFTIDEIGEGFAVFVCNSFFYNDREVSHILIEYGKDDYKVIENALLEIHYFETASNYNDLLTKDNIADLTVKYRETFALMKGKSWEEQKELKDNFFSNIETTIVDIKNKKL